MTNSNDNSQPPVSGYGQGKGSVVHIIVNDVFLHCDKKREMLPEEGKTIDDVSCAKCKRSALYKSLAEEKPKTDKPPEPKVKKKVVDKIAKGKKKTKPKAAPKKKPENKKKSESKKKKPPEKNEGATVETFVHQIVGDSINIIHSPTGTIMFNRVPIEIINVSLAFLNSIDISWEKGSPPDGFISLCREAYRASYEELQMEPPESLNAINIVDNNKKEKKGDRKLKRRRKKEENPKVKKLSKRRDKKVKKLSKRRDKKPKKLFGIFVEGKVPYTVAKMVKEGAIAGKIIDELHEKHGINYEQAARKLKKIVFKKMIDKAKLTVQVTMRPDPYDWHFIVKEE